MCGREELLNFLRVAAQVTTVAPPRSESLIPARVIDQCADATLGITEGHVRLTQGSQLLVARTLLTEFADAFAHSADALGRTSIVKHEIRTNESKQSVKTPDVYLLVNEQWLKQRTC